MVEVAQQHHLSLFATDAAAKYRAEGLIADTSPLTTHISVPTNGAVLKGTGVLSATVSDPFVTKVEFEVTGGGSRQAEIFNAEPYRYGWFAQWQTTTAPNGPYQVQSVAFTAAGRVARSAHRVSGGQEFLSYARDNPVDVAPSAAVCFFGLGGRR